MLLVETVFWKLVVLTPLLLRIHILTVHCLEAGGPDPAAVTYSHFDSSFSVASGMSLLQLRDLVD